MLILLATFLANKSLEHYKNIDALRTSRSTEFVKACQDVWSQVYAYEATKDEINELQSKLWLSKQLGLSDTSAIIADISKKLLLVINNFLS